MVGNLQEPTASCGGLDEHLSIQDLPCELGWQTGDIIPTVVPYCWPILNCEYFLFQISIQINAVQLSPNWFLCFFHICAVIWIEVSQGQSESSPSVICVALDDPQSMSHTRTQGPLLQTASEDAAFSTEGASSAEPMGEMGLSVLGSRYCSA